MMRVLLVCSVGGHLTEAMQLAPLLQAHRVSLVVNDKVALPDFPFENVYHICHAERDLRVAYNIVEAARIMAFERPDVIVSTGAGLAVPFALLARVTRQSRFLFVESAAAVTHPTLTGRIVCPLADRFFYQWPQLWRHFPRGERASVLFG
jgi:beta-1,4-N-acetylglucosaminyltransferase